MFQQITVGTIYLMGGSFILGSLCTLLLLIILELIRSSADKKTNPDAGE